MRRLVSSESFTDGHPDKVADQISDSVLDTVLDRCPDAVATCETLVTTQLVLVGGEVRGFGEGNPGLDIADVVRRTLRRIGCNDDRYGIDADSCSVLVAMGRPLGALDDGAAGGREDPIGRVGGAVWDPDGQAGVYGYATDEHPTFLPQPVAHAHALSRQLAAVRRVGGSVFGPRGSAMVTVEYEDQVATRVVSVAVSTQHDEDATTDEVESAVAEQVLGPVLDGAPGLDGCSLVVNPLRQVVPGGPHVSWGLTGRTIIADTYGGVARHGGAGLSGKDPSRFDRAGAYASRWVAKNLVASGVAARCEVHLSSPDGRVAPATVAIDTFGTEQVDPTSIAAVVREVFDLRPSSIVRDLDLRRPIYSDASVFGHFGRVEAWCTWERLDRVPALTSAFGLG